MIHSNINKGRKGELMAVQYLKENGYRIVKTNWRCGHKEIDIIALKDNEVVFIEVKYRASMERGLPEESITPRKQHHLVHAADTFLRKYRYGLSARFDVITITGNHELRHFPYAFYPSF